MKTTQIQFSGLLVCSTKVVCKVELTDGNLDCKKEEFVEFCFLIQTYLKKNNVAYLHLSFWEGVDDKEVERLVYVFYEALELYGVENYIIAIVETNGETACSQNNIEFTLYLS